MIFLSNILKAQYFVARHPNYELGDEGNEMYASLTFCEQYYLT